MSKADRGDEARRDPDAQAGELSPGQLRFAREHDAVAGTKAMSGEAIFLYRTTERGTERWLVDRGGAVRDTAFFPSGERDDQPAPRRHGPDR